jgi:hypothetical protein
MFRCHRRALVAGTGLLLISVSPLRSQQPSPFRDLLVALRDSASAVRAGVTEFSRDLRAAESDSILARAATLRARCQGAESIVPGAIERIQQAARSGRARHEAASLVVALRGLHFALQNCVEGFSDQAPGERADTLRAWGIFRSNELDQSIRSYELSANRFAEASGFKLNP